jgi:hypothetical protein
MALTDNNGHLNGGGSPSAVDHTVADAIAAADIYHTTGTTYLHIDNPLLSNSSASSSNHHDANPTGAVVPPISLATTFRQNTPGEPMARGDPNSFGMGFEYSRTGKVDCSYTLDIWHHHDSLFLLRSTNDSMDS